MTAGGLPDNRALLDAVRRDDPVAVAALASEDDGYFQAGRLRSCLAEALRLGHRGCVLRLMEAMPRLSVAAKECALYGMIEGPINDAVLFERLLDRDAQLPYDPGGRAIEHTFAALGRPKFAAVLFKRKKLCHSTLDPEGWTPMLRAIEAGDTATARVFIENGADLNARIEWKDRRSALHIALDSGEPERVVRWLLENGIDARLADAQGRSAAQLAHERGMDDIARLIETRAGSGGPRWHREAVERGFAMIIASYQTRGDGFAFDPRQVTHPFIIGGDHDGFYPETPIAALDYIRRKPLLDEHYHRLVPWVPLIERMIAGDEVGLDELLPLGGLMERPWMLG